MNDTELIKSGIYYEYEEDDISFSELNLSEEYSLFEYLDEHGALIKSKKNGFYNAYDAYYDDMATEEEVYLYEIPGKKYIVHGQEECIDGDGISELSFPIYITSSYEKALDYYNSVSYQEAPIETQIKNAHQKLDGQISGLWFDAKPNGYPGCFAWNIKKDYNLLIEKARELDLNEITHICKRYKELLDSCSKKGIHFQSMYKKPRGWNQNQRYYVFEFFAGGKEWKYEAHIPSKMQNKKRIPLDYLREEWLIEMEKAEKAFIENGGAKCEVCGQGMLKADGCNAPAIRIKGKVYQRYRVREDEVSEDGRCFDCGAKVGFFHHYMCDMERCPKCGGQMLSCDCDTYDLSAYQKDEEE